MPLWLPPRASLAWGSLVPNRRTAWDGALLRLPPAVFPGLWRFDSPQGHRLFLFLGSHGRFIFASSLGNFWSVFVHSHGLDHIAHEMCGFPLPLIFWEGELILEHWGDKLRHTPPKLFGLVIAYQIKDFQLSVVDPCNLLSWEAEAGGSGFIQSQPRLLTKSLS